jgi:hypothetical protein
MFSGFPAGDGAPKSKVKNKGLEPLDGLCKKPRQQCTNPATVFLYLQ